MSKRLLSLLMTLALCFSMLPSAALAETADAAAEKTQNVENDADVYTVGEDTVLQSGEEGGVAVQASGHNHKVGSKSAAFTAWTESDSLPSVPGYYYLTGPVELDEVYTPPRSDGSTEGVVLCLNGYDITSSGSEAIVVYKDRTFTLCDCKDTGKITRSQDDTADYTGGGVTVNGTFNMYGGNITGHKLYNNAGVSLENANAVFNMYGGTVSGNKTTKKSGINGEGAGVAVNSGTFNMYDGTITGNTADLNGAGVYVYPDGTFNMYNGTISGNTAGNNGGGVYVLGTFTMENGTISGNTAKSNSGGVFVSKSNTSVGTFIMTGGSIIGNNVENTTSGLGGGVLVNTDAIMKISGDIEIQNNRKGGTLNEATGLYEQGIADNLCLAGSSDGQTPVTVIGALTGSMPVGISKPVNRMPATGKPVKIAVGEGYTLKEADIDCFTPDAGSGYRLIYNNDDGALYLELKPHEHPICGENCTHNGTHGNEVWTAISTASELTTAESKGGFYYLTADIAQGSGWSAWTPIKDVVLCLNGHSITHNGDKNVINVKKNVTFTLCDCNGSESTRKFTEDKSGQWQADTSGDITVTGGIITHAYGKIGSGVSVSTNGTFNMYGGTLCGNNGNPGGGVYADGGTFNMYGGALRGNIATAGGGASVGSMNGGTFNMYGGTVTDNSAGSGGGVYVSNHGSMSVSGSVCITDNKNNGEAVNNVELYETGSITIGEGGLDSSARIGVTSTKTLGTGEHITIAVGADNGYHDGNIFSDKGGDYAILREGNYVNLYNGLPHNHPICGDKSCTNEEHKLPDGAEWVGVSTLDNDMAAGYYYLTDDVNVDTNGGAWSPDGSITLCLNGHSISASSFSNVINVRPNKTITLCDCDTQGRGTINAVHPKGDGVYLNGGTLNLYGGTVIAREYGVYVAQADSTFNMHGGTIKNSGTGVYMATKGSLSFNMTGGTITGNGIDADNAGGVYVGSGLFKMSGGSITQNRMGERTIGSGGVYIGGGTFEMGGNAVISDNSITIKEGNKYYTSAGAGGVYVGGGTFKMSGDASVTGNTVKNNSTKDVVGGVYVDAKDAITMTVTGNANVSGNTGGNVYLPNGKSIAIEGDLGETAAIGVRIPTLAEGGSAAVAANAKETDLDRFSDDSGNYTKKFSNGSIIFANGEPHEHPVCGDKNCEDSHSAAEFSALTLNDLGEKTLNETGIPYYYRDLPEGNWYLTGDFKPDATLRITGKVNLCLNGYSIIPTEGECVIRIDGSDTADLTLCDCSEAQSGKITTNLNGRGVSVTKGSFTMYGGAISGNTISGSSVKGAGVYVAEGSSFTMTGGTVSGNTISGSNVMGAGICNNGTTTIGGSAVISENVLANTESSTVLHSKDGGGIYTNGTLIVEGNAKIINNQSPIVRNTHGGGIYVSNGTVVLRENAVVTGNQVGSYGAGICMYSGKLTVSDSVQVTGNEQVYDSNYKDTGNVYICDTYSMPIDVNGELTDKARIGVTLDSTGVLSKVTLPVTIASAAENRIKEGNFVSDENKYAITVTEGGTKAVFSEHQHTWEYAASGAAITAKCSVCKTGGGSVTITAPDESTLTYDGNGKKATLNGSFNTGEAMPAISYIKIGKFGPEKLENGALPTNAGDYQASITIDEATAEVTYTIKKALLTADDFVFTPPQNPIYDGTPKTAAVSSDKTGVGEATVKYYDKDGKEAVPENAGTYTVKITVTEGANYAAVTELTADLWTFTVLPNLAAPTVDMSGDTTYTGKQIKPEVSVKVGNTTLTEGTDYTVTYGENKNVGTGTVTVTAKGNYGFADVTENFGITPKSVTVSGITAADKVYDGTADVTLDYSNAAVEGKAEGDELTVSADGVFAAADADRESAVVVNLSLTLGGKDKDNYVIDSTNSQSETRAKISPAVLTVTPNAGQSKTYNTADPELTYTYSGAANGETPVFTGEPARAEGENVGEYTINLGTLKLADGSGFKSNNYDLKLADTVVKFTINKAAYGDKTASGSAMYGNDGTVDLSGLIAEGGSAARGEINDPDGVLTGTVTVSGTTLSFSFADDASKAGKTATVVVKVTDATNYDDYIITVTLTVENKLTPILEGDVTLAPAEITYGEPLNTIGISGTMKVGDTTVEGKFAWQNPDEVPEAGTHWVNWKFTPIDKKTYTEAIGSVQITVKKAKQSAKLNMTGYTYGETPVKPELTERNTDTEATYYYSSSGSGTDNIWDIYNPPKLNAGTYTMYAVISGTNNYDSFSTDPVEFTVAKATPDYKKPSGLTAKYGQTLGDIALANPEGTTPGTWSWQTPQTVLDKIGSYTYDADFKPDDPSYKGVVGAAITVTVGKADGNNLKIEELSQKYTYTTEYTYTPDWSGLPAGQTWSYNSEYSVSAGSTAKLTTHDFKADGSLLTYAVSGGKAGDIVTVTLKASCSNYEDFTVTLNITLADRDAQAALHVTGDNTVVYGQTLALGSDGGSGTGEVTYAVTNGTGEAAIDPKTGILTPVKVGTVTVTAAKAGDNDFKEAVSAPFEITITQAASEGEPNYTKITRSGKTLNDAALTTEGSTLNPNAGTLEWLDDEGNVLPNDTKVEANKTYKWRFTPDDGNYAVLTGEIELYHVSSGGGVGNTISASVTVTFDADGGSKLSNQNVAKNTAVKEPAAPTKEGYDFAGWYTDKELTAKYDFSAKVTGSMTLYAAWTKKDNSLNQIILTIGEKDALVFGVVKTNVVAPQIVNDRTMLPARFVAENLGAKVSWDGEKELVTIKGRNSKTSEDITILIYIGLDIAYVNGREFKLDSAAFVENDRTYTPVRFISEKLGASVEWIESEQKVVITK